MRAYIGLLFEFAGRPVLSLQERQSIVGTMQRAARTRAARQAVYCTRLLLV